MAETVVVNGMPTGLTLTMDIFPLGSDTADITGVALTELVNSVTTYTASVTGLSGKKNVLIKYGTDVIAVGTLNIVVDSGIHVVDDTGSEIYTRTGTELVAVPGDNPTLSEMLQFLYQALRNQSVETSGSMKLTKGDGTVIGTATLTDDGTTLTKSKYS